MNAANHENGTVPLLMAAQNGHREIVEALIDAKADVNAVNQENGTVPLLMAAQEGYREIVEALIDAKADVNAVNQENGTFPLLMAAQNGHREIVKALIDAKADVNAVNQENGTFPLLMAAQIGHSEIVKALIDAKADVNAANHENGTVPLLMAAQNGHREIVEALIDAKADVNAVSQENGTFPLLMAAQNGHREIVEALIAAKADLKLAHSKTQETAVDVAVRGGQQNVIQVFARALGTPAEKLVDEIKDRLEQNRDAYRDLSEKQLSEDLIALTKSLAPSDPWPVPHPMDLGWTQPEAERRDDILKVFLLAKARVDLPDGVVRNVRCTPLTFYVGVTLAEVLIERSSGSFGVFSYLDLGGTFVHLDGSSGGIHAVNDRAGAELRLQQVEEAEAYMRFFCSYVSGENGIFRIVERFSELGISIENPEVADALEKLFKPVEVLGQDDRSFVMTANVVHGDVLSCSKFRIESGGKIEMLEDDPLAGALLVAQHQFRDGLREIVPVVRDL